MSVIKITVDDQNLHITDSPKIAAQGVNENYVEFTCSSDWNGFGKTAHFYIESDPETVYTSVLDSNCLALIPHEITASDGRICLGLSGAKDDVVKTSEILTYRIVKGLYVVESSDPSPSTYQQMLTMVGELQADQDAYEAVIDARIDTFINATRPGSATTLWTGSIHSNGDSATLSANVSGYDFLDIYLTGVDSKFIRIPTSQTSVQIQCQNLSDSGTSAFLYLWETGVAISGTTVAINKCNFWQWDFMESQIPSITTDADNGPTITRIDGIKMADESPAELLDIRVGADGTTYTSAGNAVRGQFTSLNDEINNSVSKEVVIDFSAHPSYILNDHGLSGYVPSLPQAAVSVPISVDGISKIKYTCTVANQYNAGLSFTKSNSFPIDNGSDVVGYYMRTSVGTHYIDVPSGAKYLWVCVDMDEMGEITGTPSVKLLTSVDDIIELNKISGVNEQLNDSVTLDFTTHSGYRLKYNGEAATSSLSGAGVSQAIPVSQGTVVEYTTTTNNPNDSGIVFTDTNTFPYSPGNIKGYYIREGIGTYSVSVPDGAKYFFVTADMSDMGVITGTPSAVVAFSLDGYVQNVKRIDELENGVTSNAIDIPVPSVINAFVGETLQLYYRSMFKCVDPYIYDITVQCDIGDQYPRYYQVTPTSDNIGSHTMYIKIRNNNGDILGEKSVVLAVHSAPSNPASAVNILAVGASCTQNGEWVGEMHRVLSEDYGITNANFVGRKSVNGVKLEATGGYTWGSYTETTVTNLYKFFFTSQTLPSVVNIGNVYTHDGKTFTVTEINIPTSDGGGYISCTGTGAPEASGTLTLTSGEGDSSLTFTTSSVSGNPFLYNGSIDIEQYANDYCDGQIDVVYTELFVNDSTPYNSSITTMMNSMKSFCEMFHTAFPNCKIVLGMPYCPDIRGGMGVNYHAVGGWSFGYGIKTTFMNYMLGVEEYLEDNGLDSYVSIVNWLNEFDSENDFSQTTKAVNTRSEVTETFGVNGIHPSNVGYYQMADSAVRHFVANFC